METVHIFAPCIRICYSILIHIVDILSELANDNVCSRFPRPMRCCVNVLPNVFVFRNRRNVTRASCPSSVPYCHANTRAERQQGPGHHPALTVLLLHKSPHCADDTRQLVFWNSNKFCKHHQFAEHNHRWQLWKYFAFSEIASDRNWTVSDGVFAQRQPCNSQENKWSSEFSAKWRDTSTKIRPSNLHR